MVKINNKYMDSRLNPSLPVSTSMTSYGAKQVIVKEMDKHVRVVVTNYDGSQDEFDFYGNEENPDAPEIITEEE